MRQGIPSKFSPAGVSGRESVVEVDPFLKVNRGPPFFAFPLPTWLSSLLWMSEGRGEWVRRRGPRGRRTNPDRQSTPMDPRGSSGLPATSGRKALAGRGAARRS